MVNIRDIVSAYTYVSKVVKRTPLEYSKSFSDMTGARIYLKLENLQATGSFKIRGAYSKIDSLEFDQVKNGVVCASAGNHAQGVAYASKILGVKSTIFMPTHTPPSKILATKSYGANVRLVGETYDDAYKVAKKYQEENGATFIHAFNDDAVIAGQGTIGLEILEDLMNIDVVFVPIGGGGLISGIATAIKEMRPSVKVIGVQAGNANAMYDSFHSGKLDQTQTANTIADGIAVKHPGDKTYEIIKKYVDDVVTVSEDEIANAMYLLLERTKLVVEPAGAVSLAAALKTEEPKGTFVCVISGGNVNLSLLSQIIERGMIDNSLLTKVSIIIPDKPKSFKDVLATISNLDINIRSVKHERCIPRVPVGCVELMVTLETIDAIQIAKVRQTLSDGGYEIKIRYEGEA